jgi:hypothetical protein
MSENIDSSSSISSEEVELEEPDILSDSVSTLLPAELNLGKERKLDMDDGMELIEKPRPVSPDLLVGESFELMAK